MTGPQLIVALDAPIDRVYFAYVVFRPDGRPCYVGKGRDRRWMHSAVHGGLTSRCPSLSRELRWRPWEKSREQKQ